ncbi:MAG: LCP family protein [Anaerovoracaceae bacterium]|jgi:LCP family protein required for cell wall assembly
MRSDKHKNKRRVKEFLSERSSEIASFVRDHERDLQEEPTKKSYTVAEKQDEIDRRSLENGDGFDNTTDVRAQRHGDRLALATAALEQDSELQQQKERYRRLVEKEYGTPQVIDEEQRGFKRTEEEIAAAEAAEEARRKAAEKEFIGFKRSPEEVAAEEEEQRRRAAERERYVGFRFRPEESLAAAAAEAAEQARHSEEALSEADSEEETAAPAGAADAEKAAGRAETDAGTGEKTAESGAGTGAETAEIDAGTGAETAETDAGTGAETAETDAGTGAETAETDAGTGAETAESGAGTGAETAETDAGTGAETAESGAEDVTAEAATAAASDPEGGAEDDAAESGAAADADDTAAAAAGAAAAASGKGQPGIPRTAAELRSAHRVAAQTAREEKKAAKRSGGDRGAKDTAPQSGGTSGGGHAGGSGALQGGGGSAGGEENPGGRPQRPKKKTILIVVTAVLILILCAFLGVLLYLDRVSDGLHIVETSSEDFDIDPQVAEDLRDYENIAILGIDARKTESSKGSRSDAIIIASIHRDDGRVRLCSVMRDSYLQIEDADKKKKLDKLTHAHAYGGPVDTCRALNRSLDLNISEYLVFNWKAVANLVDAVGGIDVDIKSGEIADMNHYGPESARNTGTRYHRITSPGRCRLNGAAAVTYCRIRKNSGGDPERGNRYKRVMEQLMKKAARMDAGELNTVAAKMFPEITTNLNKRQMLIRIAGLGSDKLTANYSWPRKYYGGLIDGVWYAVPETLESNVSWLHGRMFAQNEYQLTKRAKALSQATIADTGYGADSAGDTQDEQGESTGSGGSLGQSSEY